MTQLNGFSFSLTNSTTQTVSKQCEEGLTEVLSIEELIVNILLSPIFHIILIDQQCNDAEWRYPLEESLADIVLV